MSTPAGDDLVGNATVRVDGDTDPATRALARFSRDAQGRLRDVRGRFVAESALINRTITNNTPTLTVNTTPATNALNQFTRDANGRLRDVRGRFVRAGDDISNSLTTAAGGGDRFSFSLRGLANAARSAAGILGRVGIGIGAVGAAAGTAAPLLAGIVTTLENIAPAGAVAVTGMLAVQQASAAIRLGMVGVEDAVTAAFDTSKKGAEDFEEALKKLSPSARAFAEQVRAMAPGLREFQQSIQERLFTGLDDVLQRLASTTMPTLRSSLQTTATTLRTMAVEAAGSAAALADDGTLGKAMKGANQGLVNLATVPARVVTALGQLAAAGAPAFDRFTSAITRTVDRISDKISTSFQSGRLTGEVNAAADVLADLGDVASNVFGILGNIAAPIQQAGGGLVGTLKEITGALRDATATEGFRSAISAVSQVMATLARTVGPLLGQALAAIGPIFTTLGPPVERLIISLGEALSPIIENLGPVLAAAAGAVGVLVDALSPLLPVIGQLIASLLPPLIPAIDAIAQAWAGAAPIVQQLADILAATLAPIIAALPEILAPLISVFTQLTSQILPVVSQLLTALGPSLVSLGQSFANLLVAVAPLIGVLGQFAGFFLSIIIPALTPVINLVGQLASILAGQLASTITNVVMPAFQTITALLTGDFSGAWESLKTLVSGVATHFQNTISNILGFVSTLVTGIIDFFQNLFDVLVGNSIVPDMINAIVRVFASLPGRALSAIASLAGNIAGRVREAGSRMLSAARTGISNVLTALRGLPGRAKSALGNLSGRLTSAGRDLIRGMISGIKEMAGSLVSAAKGVVQGAIDGAKNLLGISSPSKVFAQIGRDTGRGFIKGLTGTRAQIGAATKKVIDSITRAFRGTGSRIDDRLVAMVEKNNKKLLSLAKERDQIAKKIAEAQKFAADVAAKARATGSLSSIVSEDFFAPSFVEKQMKKSLAQIKQFTANVAKLQKKGLSKALLQQILELGPEQGAAFAASLAGADKATIKSLNSLQSQIGKASTKLGKTGADLLFDSGKKASQGFLTGLKAQQKQIEQLMLKIAKGMQKAIKKALGIKSPSTVLAALGRMSVLGLQNGITRTVPAIDEAMTRVARAVTTGVPTTLPAVLGAAGMPVLGVGGMRTAGAAAGAATVNITLNLTNQGVIGSRMETENWLARALDSLDRTGRLPRTLRRAP